MAYAIDDTTKEKIQVDPATDTYTKTETNDLLVLKANASHTHDDRYYTESESNNRFLLPVGAYMTRFDAKNNGGMPYGTWELIGTVILDAASGGASTTIMMQVYKRTS